MKIYRLILVIQLFIGAVVFGIGPHELALLYNADDPDSTRLAEEYARLRQVPESNLVPLELGKTEQTISPDYFVQNIWRPANAILVTNGVDGHILVWAYSCGFPTRIATDPVVSITGYTFVRTNLPEAGLVNDGLWRSPLFIGPEPPAGNILFPKSLHSYRRWLGSEMPLPSVMLAHTGAHGLTIEAALAVLKQSAAADASRPSGTIYLLKSDDVRSTCRHWQFELIQRHMRRSGIDLYIGRDIPPDGARIAGLMMGAADVRINKSWQFLPGAYAEHLTSHAGDFTHGGQTKLTAWLRAGASASSGTVIEPLSNWRKFPSAAIFSAYVDGCTLVESIYQSVRSPLQLLVVGDPLAAPWKIKPQVVLSGVPANAQSVFDVSIKIDGEQADSFTEGIFLLNGRPYARGMSCRIDPAELETGVYRLRGIARYQGLIMQQVFLEQEFTVSE